MSRPAITPPPIERFAQLCALLDDGFAVRGNVLGAAGLDEAGWQALRAEWLPRLASDDADLAHHFGRAYAHALKHPGYLALPEPAPPEVDAEDTDAASVATAPDTDPTEGTVAGSSLLTGPALPFRVPALLPLAVWAERAAESSPDPPSPVRAASNPAEATLEVPCAPFRTATGLPFSSPTSNGRRQRLHRFDTQTGHPLPTPVWVDEPTPAR